MTSPAMLMMVVPLVMALTGFLTLFLVYIAAKYTPFIVRVFEEKPLFLPLRVSADPAAETVRFPTGDGLTLEGSYFPARTARRAGVIAFCHEYLSDRWSVRVYADWLRDLGFDLFAFDFRNHGQSDREAGYQPMQWVSNHEVRDLQAALAYLKRRPDADPAGVGLFGISRGGGTALCVAATEPAVWGVVTDGAFPTRGMMSAYIMRWYAIYLDHLAFWHSVPRWMFLGLVTFAGWAGRMRLQWRLRCRFPNIERAVSQLSPRPWLMIHGAKDAYISPEIAARLFAHAHEPKELWIVPEAKHNRCREVAADAYRERIGRFFSQVCPRSPRSHPPVAPSPPAATAPDPPPLAGSAASPAASSLSG